MTYDFQFLRSSDTLSQFRSRELVSVSCDQCQANVLRTKKEIQNRIKRGRKSFFCSSACCGANITDNKVVYLECANGCGASVRRQKSQVSPTNFCSQSCSASYHNKGKQRNPPKEKSCVMCDRPFFTKTALKNRSLCQECHSETKPTPKTTAPKEKRSWTCECGSVYFLNKLHKSRRFCFDCKNKRAPVPRSFKTNILKQLPYSRYLELSSVKNKHPSWKAAHIRNFNRNWNKNLTELPCQVCGYSTHIELAHIKAVSTFPETAALGEINSPDNMLVLCRNHHWEFDHGVLPLSQIPARQ